eukprot:RCo033906
MLLRKLYIGSPQLRGLLGHCQVNFSGNCFSGPDTCRSSLPVGGEKPGTISANNFLADVIAQDLSWLPGGLVVTRFPPEPNGYLHLGHVKAIVVNFGLARQFGGRCHLRLDDTNPTAENEAFVESIVDDVRWVGGDWGSHLHFASDYFEQLYIWAELLIQRGLAYVDDSTVAEIRADRGTLTQPGRCSRFRVRSADESLALFRRMRAG